MSRREHTASALGRAARLVHRLSEHLDLAAGQLAGLGDDLRDAAELLARPRHATSRPAVPLVRHLRRAS